MSFDFIASGRCLAYFVVLFCWILIVFCSFVWVAAGKQPDLEKRVGVGGYGYPAMVALNAKKGAYAPLKSGFEVKHLM